MIYNQDIILDLNTNTSYLVVGAKQGDTGRTLTATILEDGQTFTRFSDVTQASYRIRKPNGGSSWKGIADENIDRTHYTIKIPLDQNDLSDSGRCYTDLVLQQGADILASVSFIIDVQAAPNVGAATESDNFTYLLSVINQAGSIIESAQAWATGVRGTDPVLDEYCDVQNPSTLDVQLDFDIFKTKVIPESINKTTVYSFRYVKYHDENNIEQKGWRYEYDESIVNMTEYGFTITYTAPGMTEPELNSIIEVTAVFPDPTYHNNALYYRQRAEALTYGTIDQEAVSSDDPTYHNNTKWLGQSWATGFVDGVPVGSDDPTYHHNADWLAQGFATGEYNGVAIGSQEVLPGRPNPWKNNSKYYRDVIAASTVPQDVQHVRTLQEGFPAEASAEFNTNEDRFEFNFGLTTPHWHATASASELNWDEYPSAGAVITTLSSDEISDKRAAGIILQNELDQLQKKIEFNIGIPRSKYTGISNDVTIRTDTLDAGANASVDVSVTDVGIDNRDKQFTFDFKIPRGDTGATGAYISDVRIVNENDGAVLQYKLSSDYYVWITATHNKTMSNDRFSIYKDENDTLWELETIQTNRIKVARVRFNGELPASGTLTWVSGGVHHTNIVYSTSEPATDEWRTASGLITARGIQGNDGNRGAKGSKGDKGDQGIAGVSGINGINGRDGKSVTSVTLTEDNTLKFTFFDNGTETIYETGVIGTVGPSGLPGETGRGIADITLDNNYNLTFLYTDGNSKTVGPIRGPKGENGASGVDGSSALTFAVGSVSEGGQPSVTNSGTDKNVILDFVLPAYAAPSSIIDDSTTSLMKTWSSSKINNTINTATAALPTLIDNVNTLKTEIEAAGNGLLIRTAALESRSVAQGSRIGVIEIDIDTLQTQVAAQSSGLLARTGSLETRVGVAETNIIAAGANINSCITDINNINARIGNSTISGGSVTAAIASINNVLDSSNGVKANIATLQTQIQTKQPNLTFYNRGENVAELEISVLSV